MANDRAAASSASGTALSEPRGIDNIPCAVTRHFTGRQLVLNTIQNILGPWELSRPQEVAIWGLPGAGKTQTSVRLFRHPADDGSSLPVYKHIMFLQSHSRDAVGNAIRLVMMDIRPNDDLLPNMEISLVTQRFKSWLEENEKWLLIFDNVQDANDLHALRPQLGKGHVIYNTRNPLAATRLCGPERALEMRPMSNTDSVNLVKILMGANYHEGLESDVKETVSFCRGLPLAIETLVNLALNSGFSLAQSLATARDKQALLKQKPGNFFNDDNASVGAVLAMSLDALKKKHPPAGALFMLMAYMEPSLIQISILPTGDTVRDYFLRSETYDRGCIRTPEGEAHRRKRTSHQRLDLLDYDPFQKDIWLRLLGIGSFNKKFWHPDLPRVDSTNDIALESYWINNAALRNALSDGTQRDMALTHLISSGLVRRVQDPPDTYWIHDLFAELTTAYVADESKEANQHASSLVINYGISFPSCA